MTDNEKWHETMSSHGNGSDGYRNLHGCHAATSRKSSTSLSLTTVCSILVHKRSTAISFIVFESLIGSDDLEPRSLHSIMI
jgi:hypothetical protein